MVLINSSGILWPEKIQQGKDKPFGATVGVLNGILHMIEEGATYMNIPLHLDYEKLEIRSAYPLNGCVK